MKDLFKFGYEAAKNMKDSTTCLHGEEDELLSDEERHTKECDDSAIDGTDGTCLVCGKTNLL